MKYTLLGYLLPSEISQCPHKFISIVIWVYLLKSSFQTVCMCFKAFLCLKISLTNFYLNNNLEWLKILGLKFFSETFWKYYIFFLPLLLLFRNSGVSLISFPVPVTCSSLEYFEIFICLFQFIMCLSIVPFLSCLALGFIFIHLFVQQILIYWEFTLWQSVFQTL